MRQPRTGSTASGSPSGSTSTRSRSRRSRDATIPGIEAGTAVVPIYPRHPLTLATQAQTAQAASGGRFTLGIGFSDRSLIERVFGVPSDRPIQHLRDYLRVRRYFDAGATDVILTRSEMRSEDDMRRAWRLAGELARQAR